MAVARRVQSAWRSLPRRGKLLAPSSAQAEADGTFVAERPASDINQLLLWAITPASS